MHPTALLLLSSLALACLTACSVEGAPRTRDAQEATLTAAPPAPGALAPQGVDALQRFLSGRRFTRVGGGDEFAFANDGRLEARLQGVELRARFIATLDTLTLTQVERRVGDAWVPAPAQTHALGWMDGKLNVAIDGENYRDMEWSPVR